MNSVQVLGNVTKEPIIRATKTGRAVASFSVAVNRRYITANGEEKQLTDYVKIIAWGALAEAAGNELTKGSYVFVEGRYSSRSYTTPSNELRYVYEVVANMIAVPIGQRKKEVQHENIEPAAEKNEIPGGNWNQFGPSRIVPPRMEYDQEEIPF